MRDHTQRVHYICPPPDFVGLLMEGIKDLGKKNTTTYSVIKATMVSFEYVYVHPFEDGNGRIHRFLIHDILIRDRIVPNHTVLPVSAQILNNMEEYDTALESFSTLVGRKVKYQINNEGEIMVENKDNIKAIY